MANAGTHRLNMANTSDNNTKHRKNNVQNEIKYIHTKFITYLIRYYEYNIQNYRTSFVQERVFISSFNYSNCNYPFTRHAKTLLQLLCTKTDNIVFRKKSNVYLFTLPGI